MSKLYFLNQNQRFFSTYTDKGLVISTPDKKKMHTLKDIIDTYQQQNKAWVNKCTRFYDMDTSKIVKLGSQETRVNFVNDSYETEVYPLDASLEDDLYIIKRIHQRCNCDLFVMYNLQYTPTDKESVLTLQGVHVTNMDDLPIEGFDFIEYFDTLYQLDLNNSDNL